MTGTESDHPEAEAPADFAHEDPPPEFSQPSLLVLFQSLGIQALAALGELPAAEEEAPPPDLGQAKYTIDLLQVLRDKTDGNRSEEEDSLLTSLLYDLRMKYVARAGASS